MARRRLSPREPELDRGERNPDSFADSSDPSGPCPRCGRVSTFELAGSLPLTAGSGYVLDQQGQYEPVVVQRASVLICRGCGQGLVVAEDRYIGERRAVDEDTRAGGTISWRGVHWWPVVDGIGPVDDVPESVRSALAEAARCLWARAPRAAAVMLRRTVEAIVSDRGSDKARAKSRLWEQLDQMAKDGALDATMAEWAKEVRLAGNAGGHFDPLDAVSEDEADDLMRLCRGLIDFLYVMPAKVRRARRGGGPPTPR